MFTPPDRVRGKLQLDKLQQLPVVAQITALPLVSSLVQAFLPSLVLRIFLVSLFPSSNRP